MAKLAPVSAKLDQIVIDFDTSSMHAKSLRDLIIIRFCSPVSALFV